MVDRYDQYRVTIKSIRNIEASVQPSRDRKASILNKQRHALIVNLLQENRKSPIKLPSSSIRNLTAPALSSSSKSLSVLKPNLSSQKLSFPTSPARS